MFLFLQVLTNLLAMIFSSLFFSVPSYFWNLFVLFSLYGSSYALENLQIE